jgi:hypothetical protein
MGPMARLASYAAGENESVVGVHRTTATRRE